jgi:protein Tex
MHDIKDLKPGMILEGTVTNVANFGAFVDIGVHQDGLVHVSQLADRFVKDPSALVKAGDVVKVRVVEVDLKRKRIALSMRKDDAPPHRPTVASNEVAASKAVKANTHQRPPHEAESMPEGALAAALSEALRRK